MPALVVCAKLSAPAQNTVAMHGPQLTPCGFSTMVPPLRERLVLSSAEGATAPETLRQKDRSALQLWKADRQAGWVPPKEQPALSREISQVTRTEGARNSPQGEYSRVTVFISGKC